MGVAGHAPRPERRALDPDPPDVDDSEATTLAVAAGQVDETFGPTGGDTKRPSWLHRAPTCPVEDACAAGRGAVIAGRGNQHMAHDGCGRRGGAEKSDR